MDGWNNVFFDTLHFLYFGLVLQHKVWYYNACTRTLSQCSVQCNAWLPAWMHFKAVLHAGDVPPIHFSSSDSGNDGFPWLGSLAISELCLAWLSFPPQETADARCFWFILHSKISTVGPETLANLAFSDCLYRLCLTSDDAAAAFHQVSMQVRSPLNKKA